MAEVSSKSIFEIEVKDEAFKAFNALFQKYQKDLDEMPKAWQRYNAAVKSSENPFKKISDVLKATAQPFKVLIALAKDLKDETKKADKGMQKFQLTAIAAGRAFWTITKASYSLAKNIKDITLNIAKWAALGLFSLAAGGFGLKELGESAGRQRREAQGLGISTGEHAAAKINFERFVDVDSMLAKIQEARTSPEKAWTLQAAGLSQSAIKGKDNAEVLKLLLPALKASFAKAPAGSEQTYANAHGLSQFAGIGELTRLKSVNQKEIDMAGKRYDSDKKALQVSDKSLTAWQNFTSQMQRAGAMIENVFITHLGKLAGPVGRLSASFAKAVDTIFKSGTADKWIKKAAEAIDTFAQYLSSDKFPEDLKKFTDALETTAKYVVAFGEAVAKAMDFLGLMPETKEEKIKRLKEGMPANSGSSIPLTGDALMKKAVEDTHGKGGSQGGKVLVIPQGATLPSKSSSGSHAANNIGVTLNVYSPAGGNQFELINAAGVRVG